MTEVSNISVFPADDNIAALIISFNPDDKIVRLVNNLSLQCNRILIVDNGSESPKSKSVLNSIQDNAEIIRLNENTGIASALNQGISILQSKGYQWILQFDQDSLPHLEMIKILLESYNQQNDPLLALLGSHRGQFDKKILTIDYSKTVITSGSLISVKAWEKSGKYREDLFIDGVDFEMALRLNVMGYHSGNCRSALIQHQLGETEEKGNKIVPGATGHSPLRRYYRARNIMILSRLYLMKYPAWILKYHGYHAWSILTMLFSENNRSEKIKSIVKGYYHGLKFRLQ